MRWRALYQGPFSWMLEIPTLYSQSLSEDSLELEDAEEEEEDSCFLFFSLFFRCFPCSFLFFLLFFFRLFTFFFFLPSSSDEEWELLRFFFFFVVSSLDELDLENRTKIIQITIKWSQILQKANTSQLQSLSDHLNLGKWSNQAFNCWWIATLTHL